MREVSRFASSGFDESRAPGQRIKLFKELARLRASELPRAEVSPRSEGEARPAQPRGLAKE